MNAVGICQMFKDELPLSKIQFTSGSLEKFEFAEEQPGASLPSHLRKEFNQRDYAENVAKSSLCISAAGEPFTIRGHRYSRKSTQNV